MPIIRGTFVWPLFIPMIVLLGIFLFHGIRSLKVVLTFQKTTGTITEPQEYVAPLKKIGDVESISAVYGDSVYFTVGEKTYVATSRSRSSAGLNLKEGEQVTVYYDPADPTNARIGIFRELGLVPLIWGVIWSVFFIMWFGMLVGPPQQPPFEDEEVHHPTTERKS